MSSLHKSNVVDLESADINCSGGGTVEVAAEGGGCAPHSSNGNEIVNVKEKDERRDSNVSDCSVEIMDLESGVDESTLHLARNVKDCRICHLSMDATNHDSGIPIELGCSCKADLAAAHKQCAEAWFKIKGNKESRTALKIPKGQIMHLLIVHSRLLEVVVSIKICEICGSIAQNVIGINEAELMEQWHETSDVAAATATVTTHTPLIESHNFWQGHRFLNFLLACMVFAFVISWLFHFNVPS